uniref:BTB domain-containing protein n=1 Tax=Ciona savignyi TaxID=51511 RepID=H2Z7E1_CIOSA
MTKEEFLSFKFHQEVPKYGDKLLKRLDEFRKKNLYFDVKLKTLDEELVAHKVVLAACGGVFRRNFVDPTTMMIMGDVTMVEFHCPSAGILPILRFAYSGRLELSAEDLIPVFVAADVTEMHEVSDICAGVCTEKLGWILDFDGTDQQDLEVLEKILRLNLKHFENYNHKGEGEFPGLGKVMDLWPELVEIYQTVVGCVRKAVGMVGEGGKEDSTSKDSKAGSENVEGTAKSTGDSNKTDADEVKSCGTDVSPEKPAND